MQLDRSSGQEPVRGFDQRPMRGNVDNRRVVTRPHSRKQDAVLGNEPYPFRPPAID
jgi:hypothetical protein